MKLYVASSWRNDLQPKVIEYLIRWGHECYDFRHPEPNQKGFSWSEICLGWKEWTPTQFRQGLVDQVAKKHFALDYSAMLAAEAGVLVLPCGRSAHIEAGYFNGAQKPLFILLERGSSEPELMYSMATAIAIDLDGLLEAIETVSKAMVLQQQRSERHVAPLRS